MAKDTRSARQLVGVAGIVVAFDLDLTLIDTFPSISFALEAAVRRLHVVLNVPRLLSKLGPRMEELLATELEPTVAAQVAACYRRIYVTEGFFKARLLPGARRAIDAVHALDGKVIVITGQNEDSARRHLTHESLSIDTLVASESGATKQEALILHHAAIYVGDQPQDVKAARAANATAVAVTTGRHGMDELSQANAVLDSLGEFPTWFHSYLRSAELHGSSPRGVC